MTKTRVQPASSPSPSSPSSQRPKVLVEARVSELVRPKLLEWSDDLDGAIDRVLAGSDSEALHDVRVALRRIRSLLRILRPVYGRFHVDLIRTQLARVADATGAMRDEEVLNETLSRLDLSPTVQAQLSGWKKRRKQRLRAMQGSVVRLLKSGSLQVPMLQLRALLTLPCRPTRDGEVRRFARQVVLEAQGNVEEHRCAEVSDPAGMHALRIAHKRLRYAVEAFAQVLQPELRAWRDVAAKFQSVLGSLHDEDVAIEVIGQAENLQMDVRDHVMQALREQRQLTAKQYGELVGDPPVLGCS